MSTKQNITGRRYGTLVALEPIGKRGSSIVWRCQCDCGNYILSTPGILNSGNTKSCGCYRTRNKSVSFNQLINSYRKSAKKRGLDWLLTNDQFKELTQQPCYYCGALPENIARCRDFPVYIYNGVDRRDNSRGYFSENSVACCKVCNERKKAMTSEKFSTWIARVYNHNPDSWLEGIT